MKGWRGRDKEDSEGREREGEEERERERRERAMNILYVYNDHVLIKGESQEHLYRRFKKCSYTCT